MNDTLTPHQELADWLLQSSVPPPAAETALAAIHGEDALEAALRGEALPPIEASDHGGDDTPRVFLEEIRVTGFRGIGPSTVVGLVPKTGLTMIMGRNGSGKSSIADAVEFTLTEESTRWVQRPSAFRDGWRNLHHDGASEIGLTMRLDSGEQVKIRRTWPAGTTDLAAATVTTTQGGTAMPPGQVPEWIDQAARYRPFLSARDLERVITAKSAELYDAIAPILGLGPLRDADARLQRHRKLYDDRVKTLKIGFAELRAQLTKIDDDRARDALRALGAQPGRADLVALADLASSDTAASDAHAGAAARRLGEVGLPDAGQALAAEAEAEAALREATATNSGTAHRTTELLRGALDVHRVGDDRPCPVCRVGVLDQGWRDQAEKELAQLTAAAVSVRSAQETYSNARCAADGVLANVRGTLEPAATALAAQLPEPSAAMREALAVLSHDLATWDGVVTTHTALVTAAAAWLTERHDAWREPGAAIRRWADAATQVRIEAPILTLLTKARGALADAHAAIRAERLGSLAAQSDRVWRQLRHESNVEMHNLRMEGTNTSRRVLFPVAVDGVETNALGVMSQGELHALGLAVFLPRACAEASPYRFVIIDDPVQSMDPAKIDGLADVLREVAMTRQVVVFTHDDRLPEAIRRLEIAAEIKEVTRREGSIVEVRTSSDPADRYLDDARAVAVADIADEAKYLLVAGFCRTAIESVSMDRYRAAQNRLAKPYQQIQEALGRAHTTKDRLTLALFGRAVPRRDLFARLDRDYGTAASRTIQAVTGAVHGNRGMPTRAMVENTAALVGRLR